MFHALTTSLTKIFDKIKNHSVLTEEHIDSAMRDIRIALLEADVALSVVREFIRDVKEKAKGQNIIKSVSPAQMIIKIIHDEMVKILTPNEDEAQLNLHSTPPVNILIVGLQGSGKTTVSAKIALMLKNQNKKVLLVSLDKYRPAAQDQLEILAHNINVDSLLIVPDQSPLEIAKRAMLESKLSGYDIVIYDSGGRVHTDHVMLEEIVSIKEVLNPSEVLFVSDAMIGQDVVTVARVFEEKLTISGVILSKIDGDTRGGAALSIRHVIGKPIKFLGTGEKVQDFEKFDPKRIVSRILGMGDVVSLVEKAKNIINQQDAERSSLKFKRGKFDLNDYIAQINTIRKLGGLSHVLSMMPKALRFESKLLNIKNNDNLFRVQEAIVFSMTQKERLYPDLLNASRKRRIAHGSGTSIQQVNTLLKQFKQVSTMIKKTSRMDSKTLMRSKIGKIFS